MGGGSGEKESQQRAVVEQMFSEIQKQTDSKNLLTFGLEIAGLVFRQGPDAIWLEERYEQMQPLLEGSWVFQKIRQQGREEGKLQELRLTFVHLVALRFPDLESLAQQRAEKEEGAEQLRALLDKLVLATTSQEVRDVLTTQ
jgi:hypothetical protein